MARCVHCIGCQPATQSAHGRLGFIPSRRLWHPSTRADQDSWTHVSSKPSHHAAHQHRVVQAAFVSAAKPGAGDMFADSDDDVDDMFATARAALGATGNAAAATNGDARASDQRGGDPGAEHAEPGTGQPSARESGHAASEQPAAAVDYSSWPVKELKRFLTERGEVMRAPHDDICL